MYLYWLKFQAFLKDCGEGLLDFILMIGKLLLNFFVIIFSLVRDIAYMILNVISFIANIIFLGSFYFGYQLIMNLKRGISITDTIEIRMFLFMFFIPIGIHILKEIIRPKNL